MPLYEFACEVCGAREEVFRQRMTSDVEPPPCPVCPDDAGYAMRRVMSFGFRPPPQLRYDEAAKDQGGEAKR